MPEQLRPDVDAISQQGAPGGFEMVLASAAFRTISDHIPGHELRTMAAALVQRPGPALTPVIDLARQLVPIALGSDGQRTSRDRRFADPAWHTNPLLRRIARRVSRILSSGRAHRGRCRGGLAHQGARQAVGRQSVGCCGTDQQPGSASVVVEVCDRHGWPELAAWSAAACDRHGCASATSGDGRHHGVLNR